MAGAEKRLSLIVDHPKEDEMTNLVRLLVASCFAFALAAPAFAQDTKPMGHHAGKPAKTAKAAPQTPTDMLNAQSLQAAQAGQNFTPPAPK